jgi:hypothetical protein
VNDKHTVDRQMKTISATLWTFSRVNEMSGTTRSRSSILIRYGSFDNENANTVHAFSIPAFDEKRDDNMEELPFSR